MSAVYAWIFGEPKMTGFFCSDTSIRYPYMEEHFGTAAYMFVPFILTSSAVAGWNYLQKIHWKRSLKCLAQMFLGYQLIIFALYVSKFSTARLRPTFWSMCQPDVDCGQRPGDQFIADYRCNNTNLSAVRQSRLSFPSGHAGIASYLAVWFSMYLEKCDNAIGGAFVRPLQYLALTLVWNISLSRYYNYFHHWSDIVAGVALGAVTALFSMPRENSDFLAVSSSDKEAVADSNNVLESRKASLQLIQPT